jgi:hypothetical protein
MSEALRVAAAFRRCRFLRGSQQPSRASVLALEQVTGLLEPGLDRLAATLQESIDGILQVVLGRLLAVHTLIATGDGGRGHSADLLLDRIADLTRTAARATHAELVLGGVLIEFGLEGRMIFRSEFLAAVELGLHFGSEVVAQVLDEDLLEGMGLAFSREGIANGDSG